MNRSSQPPLSSTLWGNQTCGKRKRWWLLVTGVWMLMTLNLPLLPKVAQAADPLTVRVLIERLQVLDCVDEVETPFGDICIPPGVPGHNSADLYAVIKIGDLSEYETPNIDGEDTIEPNWEYAVQVDPAQGVVPITIEVRDEDGFLRFDDDHVDIRNGDGRNLALTVDLRSCMIGGDLNGGCWRTLTTNGTEDDRAQIRFRVDVNLPRTPFWGYVYDNTAPERSRPLAAHAVSIIDESDGTVISRQVTNENGQFAFDLRVLPDRSLRLRVDECSGLISCTYGAPDIATIDIQPLRYEPLSVLYPGCGPGQTCWYAPVDFFVQRMAAAVGPIALTSSNPVYPVPRYILRDDTGAATDPFVTLTGTNLHKWLEAFLYRADCVSFPNCERYPATVVEWASDGSWIKVQTPDLPTPMAFSTFWFWAVRDAWPRANYQEWTRLNPTHLNYSALYGFRFENDPDSATLGDFDGVYGNNAYICIGAFGLCPLRVRDPLYLLYYEAVYKKWVKTGTCAGIAALGALLEAGIVAAHDWDPNANFAAGFYGDPGNPNLPPKPGTYHNPTFGPRSPTNLWGLLRTAHGLQTSAEFTQEFFNDAHGGFFEFSIHGDPVARLEELRANPQGQMICLTPKIGKGHCVLPYAVEGDRIWVYDNNYPNDASRYIDVDRAANQYTFLHRPSDVWGGTGLYTYPMINIWQNERHILGLDEALDLALIAVFGDTNTLYTTPEGGRWGWDSDGSFVDALPGVVALSPMTGGAIPETKEIPLAFRTTLSAPTVHIQAKGGEYNFFAAHGGRLLQLAASAAITGTVDTVTVGNHEGPLTSFRFTPQAYTAEMTSTIGMALGDRQRAVFTWQALAVEAGGSLEFAAQNASKGVLYKNFSTHETQHLLTVETVDGESGVHATHIFGPFKTPAGGTLKTAIADWPNSSQLRMELDRNGDGVSDSTEIVPGIECRLTDDDGDDAPDRCVAPMIFVSSSSSGSVNELKFRDEDILVYNPNTAAWAMVFDGSDVGVTKDVDAFTLLADGNLLLSLNAPAEVPGLGKVDDSDIIIFHPAILGDNTAGSFSWYLHGADVGLETDGEDIDLIDFTADGRLIVSTIGDFDTPDAAGQDEDLFQLNNASFGNPSHGTWGLFFDGSAVGLANEDINSLWISPAAGELYLTVKDEFSFAEQIIDSDDIFVCTPGQAAGNTTCTYRLFWDSDAYGYGSENLDGIHIGETLPIFVPTGQMNADQPLMDEDTSEDEDIDDGDGAETTYRIFLPAVNK